MDCGGDIAMCSRTISQ